MMNVLIVEPDTILAREYKKAFEASGITAITCSEAQEAIGLIDQQQPDAVILELQLTAHSGVEFLHEFRSYEDWAEIPVFIYSSVPEYSLGANPKTWASYGVARYFYKPQTTVSQLIGAVKDRLVK